MGENNREMPKPEKEEVMEGAEEAPSVPEKSSGKKAMKPVKVVALRDGFYKLQRIKAGDKFTIDDVSQLGKWMKKI